MNANVQERSEVPSAERPSHESIMRILKLRWIGMEQEAERMQVALHRVDPGCTLLAGPFDTD